MLFPNANDCNMVLILFLPSYNSRYICSFSGSIGRRYLAVSSLIGKMPRRSLLIDLRSTKVLSFIIVCFKGNMSCCSKMCARLCSVKIDLISALHELFCIVSFQ